MTDVCPRCGSDRLTPFREIAHGEWRHMKCDSCGLDFWHRDSPFPEVRCPACGRPMVPVLRDGWIEAYECGSCMLTLRRKEA